MVLSEGGKTTIDYQKEKNKVEFIDKASKGNLC